MVCPAFKHEFFKVRHAFDFFRKGISHKALLLFTFVCMEALQRLIKRLFLSNAATHSLFCLAFTSFFFFPLLTNKNALKVIGPGVAICFFFLSVIYAGRWACKRWLLKNKFPLFFINIILLAIVFVFAIALFIYLSGLQDQREAFSWGVPLVTLFMAFGVFLTLSREMLRRQMKEMEISDQQKQSELDLLRSQLSPHFLFNTLNNLYGLSITQHEKIPSLIVKLSDLLRYSVYDTKQSFVPLNEELAYIRNYIELEKIRMADRLVLTTEFTQNISTGVRISPMVLIVFVENAFKHSKNTFDDSIRIDISLKLSDDKILFSISNSCDYDKWLNNQLEKKTGIGMATTMRRLDLLYPNEYKLHYRMEKNIYYLDLELKVK